MNQFEDKTFLIKINQLFARENISVKIGFEQEFYYSGDIEDIRQLYHELSFEDEQGEEQYEAITEAGFDIINICNQIEALRANKELNFSAKISPNLPGSALNLSVSLWRDGRNLLSKLPNSADSRYLLWAVSGLEDFANDLIYLYAKTSEAYERIRCGGNHTATKICWGYNNRSAAFRIPTTDESLIRIENRIIAADSDPLAATCATLYSIYHGIKNKLDINHKIYGDSAHEQYQLIRLIDNLEEAKDRFEIWISQNDKVLV